MSLPSIATVLTVIFVISLIALITEVFFVLWRRRHIFRRQTPPTDVNSQTDASLSPPVNPSSSKEQLLYFLCLKTSPNRIEPSRAPDPEGIGSLPEDQVIDIFKLLKSMHGPSRVLCTIKEEDREGVESDDSAMKSKSVCLQAFFEVEATAEVPVQMRVAVPVDEYDAAAADDDDDDDDDGDAAADDDDVEATPFSTPRASPLYFTPSASPSCDVGMSC